MIFSITLNNFPDWAVQMTRIVPVLTCPSGFDLEDLNFSSDYSYVWNKLDDLHYELTIDLSVFATVNLDGHNITVPVYATIDLVIYNELNHFVAQTQGK